MLNNLKYQCEMQQVESDNNIEMKPTKLPYKIEFIMEYVFNFIFITGDFNALTHFIQYSNRFKIKLSVL